jgi:hypothetical protein
MVVWFSADGSVPEAAENHTPGTPYQIYDAQSETPLNLASGGSALSWESAAQTNRPYYHTATWELTGEPTDVTLPNGQAFLATNSGDDTNLYNNISQMACTLTTPVAASANWSGIVVMFFVEDAAVARRIFEGASGDYVAFDEDGRISVNDSVSAGTISSSQSDKWEAEWVVIEWNKSSGVFNCKYNGETITTSGSESGLTGNLDVAQLFSANQLTTAYAENIIYNTNHSMEDLGVVAQQFASKYGITYNTP